MLDNIKLAVKLIGGFVLVAAISVVVGLTGFQAETIDGKNDDFDSTKATQCSSINFNIMAQ